MEIWTPTTQKSQRSPQSERDYQKLAIWEWEENGFWAENIHPSMGMKKGIPDTLFKIGPFLLPIEFKVGRVKNGRLTVAKIRPAQRKWHRVYRDKGGVSGVIVGANGKWYILTIDQFLDGGVRFEEKTLQAFATATEAIQFIGRPLSRLL